MGLICSVCQQDRRNPLILHRLSQAQCRYGTRWIPFTTDGLIFWLLADAQLFSKLHVYSGCSQIEVNMSDGEETAFTLPHGLYQFTRMPFGLKMPQQRSSASWTSFYPALTDSSLWFTLTISLTFLGFSKTYGLHKGNFDISEGSRRNAEIQEGFLLYKSHRLLGSYYPTRSGRTR